MSKEIVKEPTRFRIGKRVVKTAVAVLLCFVVYALRGQQGIPFNSAVAAIMCMQKNIDGSWKAGLNRMIGTAIGVAYGIIVVLLVYYKVLEWDWTFYTVIAVGVVLVLETSVLLNQARIADFACVNFLSIAATPFTEGSPFTFVVNRVLDMLIGIFIALAVNSMRLPKKKRRDVLFIADMDRVLQTEEDTFTPYSVITLNGLVADGALFTVSTSGTPGSFTELNKEIKLNVPAVVMDGCALYDIENNKYIYKVKMTSDAVREIGALAEERGMVCCYNVVVQDVLLIYFERFSNMAMQDMYQRLRQNPYRNYICEPLPGHMEEKILYINVLDKREKVEELESVLKNRPVFNQIRIKKKELEDNPDYLYLRICHKGASRRRAGEYLRDMIGAKQIVTVGNRKYVDDLYIEPYETELIARNVKHSYEINLWEKERSFKKDNR